MNVIPLQKDAVNGPAPIKALSLRYRAVVDTIRGRVGGTLPLRQHRSGSIQCSIHSETMRAFRELVVARTA